MNAQEELKTQIATCKCCLLAPTMKDCQVCLFKIGLAEQKMSIVHSQSEFVVLDTAHASMVAECLI